MQMEKQNTSNKKPMILVFAGPNGSGKTTVKGYFDNVGEYTNADDYAKITGVDNIQAAREVDAKRYKSIEDRKDFTFETVLSSDYKMDLLKKAKDKGYFIKCIYVLTIDPRINIARVKTRVDAGGHDVPREKIISRYIKALNNIPKLIELCDILHVYDNSVDKVSRIIRKHKEQLTIFPNDIWYEEKIIDLMEGRFTL